MASNVIKKAHFSSPLNSFFIKCLNILENFLANNNKNVDDSEEEEYMEELISSSFAL